MGYVYFLELKNGDIYVGSTDDLRRRFASHQQGACRFHKELPAAGSSLVCRSSQTKERLAGLSDTLRRAFAKKRFLGIAVDRA
jgi:predicted GIY-YIG superfamily endonuclease